MASDIFATIKKAATDAGNKVSSPKDQGPGIGTELAEKVKMRQAADSALEAPKAPTPRDSSGVGVGGTASPYGSRKGEKRIDTSGMHSDAIKTYDTGGKVNVDDAADDEEQRMNEDMVHMGRMGTMPAMKAFDKGGKVNVNDGKHELAILKHGERVLTEKQDKEYQKKMGKDTDNDADCYDEGGVVGDHFARSMHKLNKGGLHRHLGIAEGKPIPMAKKQEAANSDNPHVAAMGRLAVAMHGWKHKGSK